MENIVNILIVDRERKSADLIAQYFSESGYMPKIATDSYEMCTALRTVNVGFVIIDTNISNGDISICRQLRESSDIPIIVLISSDQKADRAIGLEVGADDCVAKPFNPRELLARVKAVLRRVKVQDWSTAATILEADEPEELVWIFSGYRLISASHTLVSPDGARTDLRRGEYELLAALVTHPNRLLTHTQLANLTGSKTTQPLSRAIEVQICRLRERIGASPHKPPLIETVRGGGYVFSAKVTTQGSAPPAD